MASEELEAGLRQVSDLQDFIDLDEVMEDEDFKDALNLALNCIARPDIPLANAKRAMLKMQAYAYTFKMKGLVYMQIHKGSAATKENIRKNGYFYASEQAHELAQTLKYLVRVQESF